MAETRNARIVKYLNLGFDDFVKDLRDFSKIFFPKTSKDLSDGSSAQMMLEQSAFIGDVLAFYLEDRFKNTNLQTAKDINQIFVLARGLGYPLRGPAAAGGQTNFYLEVPATTGSTGGFQPDMRYAANFKNVQLQNSNGVVFEALEDVNFGEVNTSSSLESRVSQRDQMGLPTHYILKRIAEVSAGKTITQTISVGDYIPFRKVEISDPNVLEIISVKDEVGDNWYQVDYHAQEAIFEGIRNTFDDSDDVPYILKLKTVPKRFVSRINPSTGRTSLIFGPGKGTEIGTPFVPDPGDIALDLKGKLTFSPPFIDPQNFLRTRTLGLAPFNTTLTVKARVGGGRVTNTSVGSLKDIIGKETELNSAGLDPQNLTDVLNSFSTQNDAPLLGGEEPETPEEIKQNASAFFAAQGRVNTREDYIARPLSMPSKFGRVFRVYAANNCNPNGGVQLYVIGKNERDQLIKPTSTLKKNLRTYLSKFTRLNQGIDILDGRIINIGLDFSIVVQPGFNKTQVKIDALKVMKEFFQVDKWSLNQPIILDDIRCLLKEVEGVLSISEIEIRNKNNTTDGQSYSEDAYSIQTNTKNGIIFAPENGMFEVKFPNGPDIRVGAL